MIVSAAVVTHGVPVAMEILGTRVVRGRDWEWGNQDGGEGCVGTVVEIGQDKKSPFTAQLVWIQWDCGTKANYRAGFDGKHDLRVFETRNQGEMYRNFIMFLRSRTRNSFP